MLKKSGQGLSITVIVAAVIGLIVVVVIVALLTERLGDFSKGVDESNSCANACKALSKTGVDASPCRGIELPGTFKEGSDCCCT